jgi:class 3 adenylate cyclase
VMDAAESERAVLYGVSEGGPLSLLFAATYPERVSKLIVYGSAACFVQKDDYPIGGIREWLDQFVEVLVSNWGKGLAYGMFIQDLPPGPEGQQMVARFERNACTPHRVREILQSNLNIDVRSILPTISVPTLVLHNVGDPLIQVELGRYLGEHISTATYIEGSGDFHGSWLPEKLKWLSDHVSAFIGATPADTIDLDRVLATVLFTDIVGSTDKTAAVGDREWRATLDRHDAIVKDEVSRYRGRLVNTTGDGVLATFDGPARGLRCAEAIQGTIAGLGLAVRAGVHTGEIEMRGDDITGLGVVIARRICDRASSGEVLASRTVKDLVTGSGIGFIDRGMHALKGVPEEWQLFSVSR